MKKEVNKMTTEQIKVLADKLRMIPGFTRYLTLFWSLVLHMLTVAHMRPPTH